MPTPEIPSFLQEKAKELEDNPNLLPDLSRLLYVQRKTDEGQIEERIIAILKEPKTTISMELWDCLAIIGQKTSIPWSCIPKDEGEKNTSGYRISWSFSREPGPTASK